MPTYQLKDVDVTAISLVKQGANGQRIFLCKQDAAKPKVAAGRIIAKSDWSAFYIVVAEPGSPENGGLLAPDATDVWDRDEILKAAHKFMENGATIADGHDAFLLGDEVAPYGTLVENAVALADFEVMQPDGSVAVVKEGSWYIAVKPTEEGKAAIEAGELGGVSVQGDATRIEMAKERAFLAKVGEYFGLKPKEPEPVAKAVEDFATRQFKSDTLWDLEDAVWHLLDVIWAAFYSPDVDDPKAVIVTSIEQFSAWVNAKLDGWPTVEVAKAKRLDLAKRLPPGVTLPADHPGNPSEDAMDQETRDALAKQDDSIKELTTAVAGINTALETVVSRLPEPEPEPITKEQLAADLATLTEGVGKIAKAVEALGEGDSEQDEETDRRVAKEAPKGYIKGLL